jgi:hypothetical protein
VAVALLIVEEVVDVAVVRGLIAEATGVAIEEEENK